MKRKAIKRMDLIVGSTLALAALITSLSLMLSSRGEYVAYEKQYNEEKALKENAKPRGPEEVYIDNDFVTLDRSGEFIESHKSAYPNVYTCRASEAEFRGNNETSDNFVRIEVFDETSFYGQCLANFGGVGGGSVSFSICVDAPSNADIDFVSSAALYDPESNGSASMDLWNFAKITINGIEAPLDGITLSTDGGWYEMQHLILHNVHLKQGSNILKIESKDANPLYPSDIPLPNISHIHVFSESSFTKGISVNGDNVYLVRKGTKTYYTMTGTCFGFLESDFFIDLCEDSSSVNAIPSSAYSCKIQDGHFLIKVDVGQFESKLYFPHFWLNGSLYNTGRIEGDVMTKKYMDKYGWDNPFLKQETSQGKIIIKSSLMVLDKTS